MLFNWLQQWYLFNWLWHQYLLNWLQHWYTFHQLQLCLFNQPLYLQQQYYHHHLFHRHPSNNHKKGQLTPEPWHWSSQKIQLSLSLSACLSPSLSVSLCLCLSLCLSLSLSVSLCLCLCLSLSLSLSLLIFTTQHPKIVGYVKSVLPLLPEKGTAHLWKDQEYWSSPYWTHHWSPKTKKTWGNYKKQTDLFRNVQTQDKCLETGLPSKCCINCNRFVSNSFVLYISW